MPVIKHKTAQSEAPETPHPILGSYTAQLISDTGGLTQFGAFTETLAPGGFSSIKHWHAQEDEMVYMLAGIAVLHEGDSQTALYPGDAATFKAGTALGHCLENQSDDPATYLVIGTRGPADVVTYPDNDRILTFQRTPKQRSFTTLDGAPADSPYDAKP
jgi:uncharacterized cupin superfamily protein